MNPIKNLRPALLIALAVLSLLAAACGSSDTSGRETVADGDGDGAAAVTSDEDESAASEPDDAKSADAAAPTVGNDVDAGAEPTSLAFASREFVPFGDSPFEISLIDGDPTAGPSTFMLKMPANFDGLMHTHEASYRAVVVDGRVRHWHLGENPDDVDVLGAGGSWSQQAGVAHQEDNSSDEPTIIHITMDGPFNLDPHEGE